jgi:hypothetical protein
MCDNNYTIQFRNETTGFEWRDSAGRYTAAQADQKCKQLEQQNRGYARGNPQLTTEFRYVR